MRNTSLPPTTELFVRHRGVVFRRCRQLLGEEELARDAVQEVFVRAMDASSSFRGDCSPQTWLYRIATTHCLQQLRNCSRRQAKLQQHGEEIGQIQRTASPESTVTLAQVLEMTDEETRQVAFFRFVDGMTLEEVADVVGLSRKTVAKRLQHLAGTLRDEAEPMGSRA